MHPVKYPRLVFQKLPGHPCVGQWVVFAMPSRDPRQGILNLKRISKAAWHASKLNHARGFPRSTYIVDASAPYAHLAPANPMLPAH